MSAHTLARIALLAATATAAHAQISFPVTITDSCNGNTVTFTLTGLPTAPEAALSNFANVNFGASGSCDDDNTYAHIPMFRFPGQSRYFAFYDSGVVGDQGYVSSFAYGNSFQINWANANNENLSVTWCARIHCCGSNGAIVDHEWRFNYEGWWGNPPKLDPIDIGFVAYTDYDLATTGGNQSSGAATGDRHLIEVASCPGEVAEFWGESPDNWEVGAWSSVISTLQTDPFPGLANGTLPFGPADYTGAMEWLDTIDPEGECYEYGGYYYCYPNEVVIRYSHSINCLQCPGDASVTPYGAGDVSLTTTALGSLGSPIDLHVPSGGMNPGVMWFGLPAAPLPFAIVFPACTTSLYVSIPISSIPVVAGVGGDVDLEFPGLFGPVFCGVTFDFQYGALDFVAACPLVVSNALSVTFGRPVPYASCASKE